MTKLIEGLDFEGNIIEYGSYSINGQLKFEHSRPIDKIMDFIQVNKMKESMKGEYKTYKKEFLCFDRKSFLLIFIPIYRGLTFPKIRVQTTNSLGQQIRIDRVLTITECAMPFFRNCFDKCLNELINHPTF